MTEQTPSPLLLLPVGVPASGKSYLAKRLANQHVIPPTAIVSSDYFRLRVTDDPICIEHDSDVYRIARELAIARLANQLDVYFDATNLHIRRINELLSYARENEITASWIFLPTRTGDALARNARRSHPVPHERMLSAIKAYDSLDRSTYVGNHYTKQEILAIARRARDEAKSLREAIINFSISSVRFSQNHFDRDS